MINHRITLRFTLVEMALALAILAVGLSAVILLSTVGAKAGRDGRAEGDLEEVSDRVVAFVQGRFSAPENWKADGSSPIVIPDFVAAPNDGDVPVGSSGFSAADPEMLVKDNVTYICRRLSGADGNVVDFEAMVRVGLDGSFLSSQFYQELGAASTAPKKLTQYPLNHAVPIGTRINGASSAAMFGKFCRPLIVEFSWPIDVVWSRREKRFLRLELFNENFVPYPQS